MTTEQLLELKLLNQEYFKLDRVGGCKNLADVARKQSLRNEIISLLEEGGDEQWKKLITHQENTHVLEI